MPKIIDYPIVLEQLTRQGLISLYHNSGAFGFPSSVATTSRGWIGPEDASIRESVRPIVRQMLEPYASTMTELLIRFWLGVLPGPVWVMPKSHWAYELEFGSREWMPSALAKIGIDSATLLPLNNAAAIEFVDGEKSSLGFFVQELLTKLVGSDFAMVFPGRETICTIHSRQQLWWTCGDKAVAAQLDGLVLDRNKSNANIEHRTSNVEHRSGE